MRTFDDAVRDRFEPSDSYEFRYNSPEEEHISRVRGPACVDIVYGLFHFLLACSFHSETIVSAFEQVAEEVREIDRIKTCKPAQDQ